MKNNKIEKLISRLEFFKRREDELETELNLFGYSKWTYFSLCDIRYLIKETTESIKLENDLAF